MGESEQRSSFYFRALNSIERILAGDLVLIDTACEIPPGAIVLTDMDFTLQKAKRNSQDLYIGKVVNVYIQR